MQVRDMIFQILKWKNGTYISETDIIKVINEAYPEVFNSQITDALGEMIEKKWIRKMDHYISNNTYYAISRYLDPVMPQDNLRPEGEFYESISSLIKTPESWMNPDIKYVARRDQRSRQICVGCSGAYARDLDYIKLTRKTPNPSETFERNVVDSNQRYYDKLYNQSFSSECIYAWSREIGQVPATLSGSYVSSAVDAMRKKGALLEKEWKTPAYFDGEVADPYPIPKDQIEGRSMIHTIDGYKAIRDFDQIKSAIYQYGYVLMPISIYSNYQENNGVGIFPEPNGYSVGSHALCWIGFSKDELYCLHSWMECEFIGGISRSYWERGAGTAFAVIDSIELDEIKSTYTKISVTSNAPVKVYVNNQIVTRENIIVESGKEYVIRVEADAEMYQFPIQESEISAIGGNMTLSYHFTPKSLMKYLKVELEMLIRSIIKKI